MTRSKHPTLAQTFSGIRADYNAAKTSRFRRTRSVPSAGASADYHYRTESEFLRLMEYARDFDRNDQVVGSIVDRACTATIQDGVQIDPDTGDPKLDADIKARWLDWTTDPDQCDLSAEHDFAQLQWLALRHSLVDGDIIPLPNADSGSIQMVEAHRCRTPSNTTQNVVHGVLLDKNTRKRLQYWFTADDVNPMRPVTKVSGMHQIDVRDEYQQRRVYHVYSPKRTTQTRGITAFAPIFDIAGMVDDIQFAKLVQQQMVTCFAIFVERQMGFKIPDQEGSVGNPSYDTHDDGSVRKLEGLGPGMMIKGHPGEKYTMDSPTVPNQEFFTHMRMMLQIIGINLGMPLILVLMDASETNFSGWRGAVDQAQQGWHHNQMMIYRRFVLPTYIWKLRDWSENDRSISRALSRKKSLRLFNHKPQTPSWPYIEPLKDASADLMRTRNALISRRRQCAERGMDWNVLSSEIVEDNAELIIKAQEKADELNGKFPKLNVTWRELACLPTPDGMTVSQANDLGQEEQPTQKEPAGAA